MTLKLLGRATSGNVQKVMFLLGELGLPHTREDYGRQFGNTATPEYGDMNPTRKVPTLVDGDLAIWESNTILRYLAAKAGSTLLPADPGPRTQVERWMDWMLAALNPVYLAGFRDAKKPEAERGPAVGKDLHAELAILEAQLTRHEWAAGPAFSLADIALGPVVVRCMAFPFGMPALPALETWRDRLRARPAFTSATAAG